MPKKLFSAFLGITLVAAFGALMFVQNSRQKQLSCENCNVLFVAFDGLQVSHSSAFGYAKGTSPFLKRFAGESFVFANAVSAASWTVPSFMSTFTSRYPSEHKLVNKYQKFNETEKIISTLQNLSPETVTVAEMFKSQGYQTGAATGDAGVSAQFGYTAGFDYYLDDEKFGGFDHSIPPALDWISKNKDGRFFFFLHGYDVHGQYDIKDFEGKFLDAPYAGPFKGTKEEQGALRELGLEGKPLNLTDEDVRFWRAVYDEKIYDADQRFEKFWNEFVRLGLDKNTLVVLFADHGTEFYEHERFDHGHTLYDELIRVPLIIRLPQKENRVIADQVRTIDILPTVFDLLKKQIPDNAKAQIRGESLRFAMEGKPMEPRDAFSETDYRLYTHKRSVRTADGWKFIKTFETGTRELYNLREDPGETVNLIDREPEKARILEEELNAFLKLTNQQDELKLKELGCSPAYPDQCLNQKPSPSSSDSNEKPISGNSGPPNIILISVDSLRADHLKSFGYSRDTAPNLEKFLEKGALFKNYIAQSYLTPISEMALQTGMYPTTSGFVAWDSTLPSKVKTLPEIMKQNGYRTAVSGTSPEFMVRDSFQRGYDNLLHRDLAEPNSMLRDVPNTEGMKEWIGKSPQKFFLWVHSGNVHWPYGKWKPSDAYGKFLNPSYKGFFSGKKPTDWLTLRKIYRTKYYFFEGELPDGSYSERQLKPTGETVDLSPEDLQWIVDQYDGNILEFDDWFGDFVDMLRQEGALDNTIIVFESEHGEAFGENGYVSHYDILDNQVHTPFAIIAPGIQPNTVVRPQAQSIDALPTILELAGLSPAPQAQGKSLVPLLRGEQSAFNEYVFIQRIPLWERVGTGNGVPGTMYFDPWKSLPEAHTLELTDRRFKDVAVRANEWKLIYRESRELMQGASWWQYLSGVSEPIPEFELYHLSVDPAEQRNVYNQYPEIANTLKKKLMEWLEQEESSIPKAKILEYRQPYF